MPARPSSRPARFAALFLLALAVTVGSLAGCGRDEATGPLPARATIASILAVGDTGEVWGPLPGLLEGQLAVAAAMRREHERDPVDALVLLGDNFYPNGLPAHGLRERVVENVVRPYCAFVDPAPAVAEIVARFCSGGRRPAPRLIAVVGNHDLETPGSVERQREAVPRLVLNWDMPSSDAPAVRELPGGLSLVLLQTEWPWDDAAVAALARALEATRGAWRVIVGHRPPIAGHPALRRMVAQASRRSGRVVHAYLAGHVHGLAAIHEEQVRNGRPALIAIAGSGSHADLQEEPEYEIEDADVLEETIGFARVDVVAEPSPRLRVTLLRARPSAALAMFGTTTLARYAIAPDGAVERLD